jgi:3-oxoacid CoA-transferase subunit A/glutaconate CoA-transferase subunit A
VIVTTEKLVDQEDIRQRPWLTSIPFHVVDAVIEVPYGAHPCNMPYLYFFDEEHIGTWRAMSRSEEGAQAYLDKYVFGVPNYAAYLELIGGAARMEALHRIEAMEP